MILSRSIAMNTARLTTMIPSTSVPIAPTALPNSPAITSVIPPRVSPTADLNAPTTSTARPRLSAHRWMSSRTGGGFAISAGNAPPSWAIESASAATSRMMTSDPSTMIGTRTAMTATGRGTRENRPCRRSASGAISNASSHATVKITMIRK